VILLGMDEDLLVAGLVFEAQLVVAAVTERAVGADRALRGLVRHRVRQRVRAVVHGAGDERPIRIAIDEVDDDLHADAGHEPEAPPRTGPRLLLYPHPARARVVTGALPVPMELHFDAAVLVDVDLLPGRAGHHRRLERDRRLS